jgi:2,3-diketo-5-methylthio-1-phosphopentane phosphatase
MSIAVLSDFDGTIVNIDTVEYLLDQFGEKDWRKIDRRLEKGEITFEQSLVEESAMLKVPEKAMLDALDSVTQIRPNFDKMVHYCRENKFPLIVATGGLEFSVSHFLDRNEWLESVQIYGPKAKCTAEGVKLTFPSLLYTESENFKDDIARHQKNQGRKVVYIGDGIGDFPAAKVADIVFAIKGSKLAERCKTNGVPCREITDFQEVVDSIRTSLPT